MAARGVAGRWSRAWTRWRARRGRAASTGSRTRRTRRRWCCTTRSPNGRGSCSTRRCWCDVRVSDLEWLYDYNYWANRKLFGALAQLTPEQFTQSVAGSYASIRNTLVHILSAEWGWLDRCGGPKRGERLNPQDYPTVESLVRAWSRVEEHMRGFLAGLKDEDLTRDMEFAICGGPKHVLPLGD